MQPKISLFASSIRPHLWGSFLKSLEGTTVECEIVFAGPLENKSDIQILSSLKYIQTKNIKPAQCYEVARRHCTGELVCWIADDCEFPDNVFR